MFKIFCDNYKTGHVATARPFILSKLKLCLYQRRSLLDQICLSPKKIIRLTVYLTLSLGVTLGNKHCWSTHIKAITANFNAKLNKLEQIWPHDLRNYLFLKYITQCNLLYFSMGLSKLITHDLEDLHIRAARLIHNVSPSIPKNEVLSKAKCYSLSYLYKKRLACIAYQAYYNLAPPGITNLFTKHVTKYNLRDNLIFDLTHSYWKRLSDSFTHRACII